MTAADESKGADVGHTTAFYDGYGAFKAGEPLSNAPFVADAAVSVDWRRGWFAARDAKAATQNAEAAHA